ncbi:MAG: hypothetical protein NC543_12075 [bacterium]|nr:hypothetical protein [bacterium]MCM1376099.1 hypothetical protein [Muribaculum sp.]
MDCRNCGQMKLFRRMGGGKAECYCCHEKAEMYGSKPGLICLADNKGAPRIKSHPRWCPLRTAKAKKNKEGKNSYG